MKIDRVVIAPHSAQEMFALVDDIAAYPEFLPWCAGAEVDRNGDQVDARLQVRFGGISTAFATRNTHTPNERIDMRLTEGPLKSLAGEWRFAPLQPQRCRIEFRLQYEFANPLLAMTMGRVFAIAFERFVEHFLQRARERQAARQSEQIRVDIVRAAAPDAAPTRLTLPRGATIASALAAAGMSDNTEQTSIQTSIFGALRPASAALEDGDRIELNAPLPNPPRQGGVHARAQGKPHSNGDRQ